MVKPRFPGHVEAPSATRRATDKWAHDTMRPEQLDSGSTHTPQPQEGCALLHPLQGVSLLSTPLQGGILKPPALRVVVDSILRADPQPDGTWACTRMTHDTTGTNGLLISPDEKTLYMIQTSPELRELRAYDILADGTLGRYVVLHQFGVDYRGPQRGIDGICFDAEGNIV